MSEKPLAQEIVNHGFRMRQIKRTDTAAMYSKAGGFEVIRISVAPEQKLFGRIVPAREVYPGDEQFGTRGWYFSGPDARDRAEAKFKEIAERRKKGGAS